MKTIKVVAAIICNDMERKNMIIRLFISLWIASGLK